MQATARPWEKLTFFAACWMAISFLNWYSNIIEEKEGPHRFPNKTSIVGVHWAADCSLQWFNTFYKIT